GPATERWWDGAAWTDQVRPAGSAAAWAPPAPVAAAGPAYPAYPVYPAPPPPGRGHKVRNGIAVAVAVAVAVLASIGVGVYALTDDGPDRAPRPRGHRRAGTAVPRARSRGRTDPSRRG